MINKETACAFSQYQWTELSLFARTCRLSRCTPSKDLSDLSISFSYGRPGQEHRVCGVGGRTEALGRLTASVCKSGPLGDSAAVRRSDRQGGYVDTGRSKLADAVSSLFEMCLWVAGRCNENLAYRDTHSWKHCVTENPSAANLNT